MSTIYFQLHALIIRMCSSTFGLTIWTECPLFHGILEFWPALLEVPFSHRGCCVQPQCRGLTYTHITHTDLDTHLKQPEDQTVVSLSLACTQYIQRIACQEAALSSSWPQWNNIFLELIY